MIGIVLALLSAAASGISVGLVRKNSASSSALNVSLALTLVGSILLWPIAAALGGFEGLSLVGFSFFAISGVLSPGVVRLLFYQGLKKLGASVSSSVYATYPLYSALLAVLLLNEVLSPWNVVGIFVILFGIITIELSLSGQNGQRSNWKSLMFPLTGAVMFSISAIIRKHALGISNVPVWGVSIAYAFSFLPFIFMLMASSQARTNLHLRQNIRWFWPAGVGQVAAWLLAFYALSFEEVSVVTPLLSIEPLFVAIFAFLYLKHLEHLSSKLFLSIALIIFGVVLVTLV